MLCRNGGLRCANPPYESSRLLTGVRHNRPARYPIYALNEGCPALIAWRAPDGELRRGYRWAGPTTRPNAERDDPDQDGRPIAAQVISPWAGRPSLGRPRSQTATACGGVNN